VGVLANHPFSLSNQDKIIREKTKGAIEIFITALNYPWKNYYYKEGYTKEHNENISFYTQTNEMSRILALEIESPPKYFDAKVIKIIVRTGDNNLIKEINRIFSKLKKSINIIAIPEDKTIEWETYRNENYGFEVKYPNEWRVRSKENFIQFIDITKNEEYPEGLVTFTIEIEKTKFNSVHEWFQKEFQDMPTPEYSEVTVDKIQGLRILDGSRFYMGAGCSETIVFLKNLLYRLERKGPTCTYSDEIFNQILSTFKFIK
jgi:hypothetical protein